MQCLKISLRIFFSTFVMEIYSKVQQQTLFKHFGLMCFLYLVFHKRRHKFHIFIVYNHFFCNNEFLRSISWLDRKNIKNNKINMASDMLRLLPMSKFQCWKILNHVSNVLNLVEKIEAIFFLKSLRDSDFADEWSAQVPERGVNLDVNVRGIGSWKQVALQISTGRVAKISGEQVFYNRLSSKVHIM